MYWAALLFTRTEKPTWEYIDFRLRKEVYGGKFRSETLKQSIHDLGRDWMIYQMELKYIKPIKKR